jgi:hypothetical protein
MITIQVVEKLIDHYEEVVAAAKKYGYKNLIFHSSGDPDTINIFADHILEARAEEKLASDIDTVLSEILGAPVLLITKHCEAAEFVTEKDTGLSEMNKVIPFFCNVLIPNSTEVYPSDGERDDLLKRWQNRLPVQSPVIAAESAESETSSASASEPSSPRGDVGFFSSAAAQRVGGKSRQLPG